MQSLYSTDCDNLPFLYLVEPVFVPNVGICQSRQTVNNFPVRSHKTKIFTCNQMQSLYSTDCDNLPFLYLVKPVFVPNVGICQSRQTVNNFPVRSRKTKIFTWKYIRVNPNVKFFTRWTLVIPLIPNKLNLDDYQKTGISTDMRPVFFAQVLEKWVGMLILWSRNQDWWSLFFA